MEEETLAVPTLSRRTLSRADQACPSRHVHGAGSLAARSSPLPSTPTPDGPQADTQEKGRVGTGHQPMWPFRHSLDKNPKQPLRELGEIELLGQDTFEEDRVTLGDMVPD